MCSSAPYLKLTYPYPILRGNHYKSSTDPVKIYGKGAGSQLPVFTVKSTGQLPVFTVKSTGFFFTVRDYDWCM